MRIVLAPDKFKDSLSARQVADAMQAGILRADPGAQIDICPMADGGEGTVEALSAATGGWIETRRVTGPLPEMKVDARFAILGDGKTAVIEMAAASGLALLRMDERNPMLTTTFGTGELIMAAQKIGVTKIILGIGGSATVDGGIGLAQACGLPVLLADGETTSPGEPLVGGDLSRVVLIKHGRGSPVEKIHFEVAADVTNPLCGPTGAALVFGPQKGATPEQIQFLDRALYELARRNDKLKEAILPGAGAAGGLGFAMAAFFNATLKRGIDIVIEAARLRDRLRTADLCITGEGRLDSSSLNGKTVSGVAALCKELKVPCVAIAGQIEGGLDLVLLNLRAIPISEMPLTLEESLKRAPELIATVVENLISPG